jgi:flavin reductase (DIM6/NTAB) family NADH-FMN oxidoreductase RutF
MENETSIKAVQAFNPKEFRAALGCFATGVTVITAQNQGRTHGMTANAFVSVSLDPPLVLVSLDNRSYMHRILPGAVRFGISVLKEDQQELSNHFAGRSVKGIHIGFTTREGIPLLDGALAYFVVQVIDVHPAGDHTLYVGQVEYFEALDDKPLLFYAGKYHHLPGREPKPLHQPENEFSLFSIGSFDPPVK